MPVARSIDLPSLPSLSSSPTRRSSTTARAVLVAAIVALTAFVLGCAYFGTTAGDGFPDPSQQWTD
jgi:hypothetical protein